MDHATCSRPGCLKAVRTRGMCSTHYNQTLPNRHPKVETTCSVCGTAYRTMRRNGQFCSDGCKGASYRQHPRSPRTPTRSLLPKKHPVRLLIREQQTRAAEQRRRNDMSPLSRAHEDGDHRAVIAALLERTESQPGGCSKWQGQQSKDGYGTVRVGGRKLSVHRVMAEAVHGPLGTESVHHICANRLCIQPTHLQPISHRENAAEMLQRNYYIGRIEELERVVRLLAPSHPLLGARLPAQDARR